MTVNYYPLMVLHVLIVHHINELNKEIHAAMIAVVAKISFYLMDNAVSVDIQRSQTPQTEDTVLLQKIGIRNLDSLHL